MVCWQLMRKEIWRGRCSTMYILFEINVGSIMNTNCLLNCFSVHMEKKKGWNSVFNVGWLWRSIEMGKREEGMGEGEGLRLNIRVTVVVMQYWGVGESDPTGQRV